MAAMTNLKIDPERLWDDLMETARIGGTPKGGICRLTLSDLDHPGARRFRRLDARGGDRRHLIRHRVGRYHDR
jgi:hypothetical protein